MNVGSAEGVRTSQHPLRLQENGRADEDRVLIEESVCAARLIWVVADKQAHDDVGYPSTARRPVGCVHRGHGNGLTVLIWNMSDLGRMGVSVPDPFASLLPGS